MFCHDGVIKIYTYTLYIIHNYAIGFIFMSLKKIVFFFFNLKNMCLH